MSKTFKITWPSGKGTEVETCDADTLDAFAMRRFGLSTYEEVQEFGTTVEMSDAPMGDASTARKAALIEQAKQAVAFANAAQ